MQWHGQKNFKRKTQDWKIYNSRGYLSPAFITTQTWNVAYKLSIYIGHFFQLKVTLVSTRVFKRSMDYHFCNLVLKLISSLQTKPKEHHVKQISVRSLISNQIKQICAWDYRAYKNMLTWSVWSLFKMLRTYSLSCVTLESCRGLCCPPAWLSSETTNKKRETKATSQHVHRIDDIFMALKLWTKLGLSLRGNHDFLQTKVRLGS